MSFLTPSLIMRLNASDPEEVVTSWGVSALLYSFGQTDTRVSRVVNFTLSSFVTCPLPHKSPFVYAQRYWRAESGTRGGGVTLSSPLLAFIAALTKQYVGDLTSVRSITVISCLLSAEQIQSSSTLITRYKPPLSVPMFSLSGEYWPYPTFGLPGVMNFVLQHIAIRKVMNGQQTTGRSSLLQYFSCKALVSDSITSLLLPCFTTARKRRRQHNAIAP